MSESQHKEFEQIHWNQLFCGIYGLAVMLSISTWTTSTNIDEIKKNKAAVTFCLEVRILSKKPRIAT